MITSQIDKLDLVYNAVERQVIGFNVTFYLFQYNRVVPPGVVTKVMGDVPKDKVCLIVRSFTLYRFTVYYNYV